ALPISLESPGWPDLQPALAHRPQARSGLGPLTRLEPVPSAPRPLAVRPPSRTELAPSRSLFFDATLASWPASRAVLVNDFVRLAPPTLLNNPRLPYDEPRC